MSVGADRYVRNATRRPVELHFSDRVVVLSAGERFDVSHETLAHPAVRPLLAGGTLTLHHAPAPQAGAEPEVGDEPRPKSRRRKAPAKARRSAPEGRAAPDAAGTSFDADEASGEQR